MTYEEKFQRVTRAHPCPVCGHTDWCCYTSYLVYCMRSDRPTVGDKVDPHPSGGYLHVIRSGVHRPVNRYEKLTAPESVPAAPVEVRDRWYRTLISQLRLAPNHQANLVGRGFTEESIRGRGYCSLPEKDLRRELVARVMNRVGSSPVGIPGFYQHAHYGTWSLSGAAGLLIPVQDHEGRVQGFQVRRDEDGSETWSVRRPPRPGTIPDGPRKGQTCASVECQNPDGEVCIVLGFGKMAATVMAVTPGGPIKGKFEKLPDGCYELVKPLRYVWLSSANVKNGVNGAGSGAPIHVSRPVGVANGATSDVVWVTEGPLKADRLAQWKREIVLSVQGVSARKGIIEEVLRAKATWCIVAFDMDQNENVAVRDAVNQLSDELDSSGVKVGFALWDPEYKGIDDALQAGLVPKVFSRKKTAVS